MRASTAEVFDDYDSFVDYRSDRDSLVKKNDRMAGEFGQMSQLPLPANFDTEAARYAGRMNAANISDAEFNALIDEHASLVEQKFFGEFSKVDQRRLTYVRWQLDRIEDAMHGSALDRMDKGVTNLETFCDRIALFTKELRAASKR